MVYTSSKKEKDNVNHPSHYETGKFECIDVMIETQGIEATKNFCVWRRGFAESKMVFG